MSAKSGCNAQGRGPRGKPVPLLVQDGWRVVRRGDRLTREAVLVEVTAPWGPRRCGYLPRGDAAQDARCSGCENLIDEAENKSII